MGDNRMLGVKTGWTMLRQGDGKTLHIALLVNSGAPMTLCGRAVHTDAYLFNGTSHDVMSRTGCKRCENKACEEHLFVTFPDDEAAPERTDKVYRAGLPDAVAYERERNAAVSEAATDVGALHREQRALLQEEQWAGLVAEPSMQTLDLENVQPVGLIGLHEQTIRERETMALRRFKLAAFRLRELADEFDRLAVSPHSLDAINGSIDIRERLARATMLLCGPNGKSTAPETYARLLIELTASQEAISRLHRLAADSVILGDIAS
jgi:hypothetical protein